MSGVWYRASNCDVEPCDEVAIDINGVEVAAEFVKRDYRPNADASTTWFEFSLVNSPKFCGLNDLGITLQSRGNQEETPYMEELEVIIERQISK